MKPGPSNPEAQCIIPFSHAGDAKFGPSTPKQNANTFVLALRLMRMISFCSKHPEFPLRSGMLLRWVHLLRQILAASPATHPVSSLTELQAPATSCSVKL